jgi:hypothetical protein
MAQKVTTELIDDMDGTIADETVTFGLDGAEFEIDLSANHAGILRDILSDNVESGRKVAGKATATSGRPQRQSASNGQKSNREHTAAIRDWARKSGHAVSDRGRIKAEVVDAFEQAHRSLASVG